jgi:hypothetical protein
MVDDIHPGGGIKRNARRSSWQTPAGLMCDFLQPGLIFRLHKEISGSDSRYSGNGPVKNGIISERIMI